jgi:hypothetical protein
MVFTEFVHVGRRLCSYCHSVFGFSPGMAGDDSMCARAVVSVLIFLFSSLLLSRVRLNASHSATRHPSSCGTRRDTRFNHIPFCYRRFYPSTFLSLSPLVSLGQRLPTHSRPHAAAVRPLFPPTFFFLCHLHTLCSISIAGTPRSPYYSKSRPN